METSDTTTTRSKRPTQLTDKGLAFHEDMARKRQKTENTKTTRLSASTRKAPAPTRVSRRNLAKPKSQKYVRFSPPSRPCSPVRSTVTLRTIIAFDGYIAQMSFSTSPYVPSSTLCSLSPPTTFGGLQSVAEDDHRDNDGDRMVIS